MGSQCSISRRAFTGFGSISWLCAPKSLMVSRRWQSSEQLAAQCLGLPSSKRPLGSSHPDGWPPPPSPRAGNPYPTGLPWHSGAGNHTTMVFSLLPGPLPLLLQRPAEVTSESGQTVSWFTKELKAQGGRDCSDLISFIQECGKESPGRPRQERKETPPLATGSSSNHAVS